MNLPELKMNRFMYRSAPMEEDDSAQYMSSSIYSGREQSSKRSSEINRKDAREIITGTIITACLIKSSDQADRIEIGQNLESAISLSNSPFPTLGTGALDYFAAYRGGIIRSSITGQGNIYLLYVQQKQKWINADLGAGQITQNTSIPNWVVQSLGVGEFRVTHNLGHLFYSVNVTPYSEPGWLSPAFGVVGQKTTTSFVISIFGWNGVDFELVDQDWNCITEINPT